jgi:hypothetical protein
VNFMRWKIWRGLKGLAIYIVCYWLVVWVIVSYRAGRVLALDEVIPAQETWLEDLHRCF